MDPRFLRTFVRVVRLGSFSAAARELGYTQSAVSQHIAVLEADVGVPLLTRRPVGRDRGGRAAARARRADPAAARRRARRRGARGQRAAVAAADRRDAARRGFAAELVAPALAVTVRVGARDEIARAVAVGELDAGVVDGVAAPNDPLRLPETGARVARFVEEPLAVAAPLDHPLAGHAIQMEVLVDARWIDAPGICAPLPELSALARADGFRAALVYEGRTSPGCSRSSRPGTDSRCCPSGPSRASPRFPSPRPALVHRTEWLQDNYG